MDREAWRAAVRGVAESRTRLSDCTALTGMCPRSCGQGNGGSRRRSGTSTYSPCCSWVRSHAESSTTERRKAVARRLVGLPRRCRSAGREKPAFVGLLMWTPVMFPQGDGGKKKPTIQDSLQSDGQHRHVDLASSLGHLLRVVKTLSSQRRGLQGIPDRCPKIPHGTRCS